MSASLRPIGATAFASALLAFGLGLGIPPNVAFAVECLDAPNSPAPANSHWYYRTDRTQQRKCWHLQSDGNQPERGAVPTAPEASVRPSQFVAANGPAGSGFKDFVAQRGGAKLSDKDVEELYAEFLEWRRRTKN
jgi:hypothetical protein